MAYKEIKLTKEGAKALSESWNDGVTGKPEKKKAEPKKRPAKKPEKK